MYAYVQRASEKLRAKRLLAGVVQVFVDTSSFHPNPQYTGSESLALAAPTSYTSIPHAQALRIMRASIVRGEGIKKSGSCVLASFRRTNASSPSWSQAGRSAGNSRAS